MIDQEWLDSINAERQKEQSGPISYEVFEIIMDKLEKEWFNLVRLLLPENDEPNEVDQAHTSASFAFTCRRLEMFNL